MKRGASLRLRLLIALVGVVAAALVLSGALLVGSTRAGLVAQLDATLHVGRGPDGFGPGFGGRPGDPGGRRLAIVVFGADGEVLGSAASGFASEPDPLPATDDLVAGGAPSFGEIHDRDAVDGSLRYRAVIEHGLRDTTILLAAPLTEVDAAIGALIRDLLLIGLAALAAVVSLGWLILRRGLQPLEAMSAAAGAIAAGDLTVRARQPHDGSEVGRLAGAFDGMLDRIEAAFAEERAARAAKEASEVRLRRFVSDASHELRTPLTTLRGYADLYAAGGLSAGAELDAAMARIAGESERMTSLVEDLLLLARLDQGRPIGREPVDISGVLAEAIADARATEPDRPIEAAVADGVVVDGDADRLRQVIANLLTNVRVHTPPDAAVEVGLSAREGRVELRVADHGPGIDPDHAERIFDRFYRADGGRPRDRGGSGLGLAIVASIVAAHDGEVHFEHTVGGGATFVVRLPATAGGPS